MRPLTIFTFLLGLKVMGFGLMSISFKLIDGRITAELGTILPTFRIAFPLQVDGHGIFDSVV